MLGSLTRGQAGSAEALLPLVYEELRRIAHRQLRKERTDHTLNTTALVHEAYLGLIRQQQATWRDRAHFCAVAAKAMRHILISYARKRRTQKRGGGRHRIALDERHIAVEDRADALLALDEALTQLAQHDALLAEVVENRFFGGMTVKEISEVMNVTERSVHRYWNKAKAYLQLAMAGDDALSP